MIRFGKSLDKFKSDVQEKQIDNQHEGLKRLCVAMIDRAVRDYCSKPKLHRETAQSWLDSDDDEFLSFVFCLSVFYEDPEDVAQLLRMEIYSPTFEYKGAMRMRSMSPNPLLLRERSPEPYMRSVWS